MKTLEALVPFPKYIKRTEMWFYNILCCHHPRKKTENTFSCVSWLFACTPFLMWSSMSVFPYTFWEWAICCFYMLLIFTPILVSLLLLRVTFDRKKCLILVSFNLLSIFSFMINAVMSCLRSFFPYLKVIKIFFYITETSLLNFLFAIRLELIFLCMVWGRWLWL